MLVAVYARVLTGDVLRKSARERELSGHENAGFLSESHGFLPVEAPRLRLPDSHAAWDQIAAELPRLFEDLTLRRRVLALPLLSGRASELGDESLLRAATILGFLAHAYFCVETFLPAELPLSIQRPWAEVRERLGRAEEVLTYVDNIIYNWRLCDPLCPDPMRLGNLRLLVPTVDTNEERIFYLTQTEIAAQATPVVSALARAQEAVLHEDEASLRAELERIHGVLKAILETSLQNINPNDRSRTHQDPVVWAKSVAPLSVPIRTGLRGPSGTNSPVFSALDVFLERKRFESILGREMLALRAQYPMLWREFLGAIASVSVAGFVERTGNAELRGVWDELLAEYAGKDGLLSRHRLKVYGYMEMAFRIGRTVTIGGFAGRSTEKTWNRIDKELEAARRERQSALPSSGHWLRGVVSGSSPLATSAASAKPLSALVRIELPEGAVTGEAFDTCLLRPPETGRTEELAVTFADGGGLPSTVVDVLAPAELFSAGDEVGLRVVKSRRWRVPRPCPGPPLLLAEGASLRAMLAFRSTLVRQLGVEPTLAWFPRAGENYSIPFDRSVEIAGSETERSLAWLKLAEAAASERSIFVAGTSEFLVRARDALLAETGGAVTEAARAAARRALERKIADGLYVEATVDSTVPSPPCDPATLPVISAVEVSRHTGRASGPWLILRNGVYDLSEFLATHPGGQTILEIYAGTDATAAFNRIHGGNSLIERLARKYLVGRYFRPRFVGSRAPELGDAHRVWLECLFVVVEFHNTLLKDQSFQEKMAQRGEDPTTRSLYKLQRAVETHERFLQIQLRELEDVLVRLEAATSAVAGDLLGRWDTPDAAEANRVLETMKRLSGTLSSLDDPERSMTAALLSEACSVFAERDREILAESAAFLRDGLEALELGDSDTARVDLARLVSALSGLSIEIARYYRASCPSALAHRLAAQVAALENTAFPPQSLWEEHDIMKTRPHG